MKINKKRLRISLKISALVILGALLLFLTPIAYSTYFQDAESDARVEIAFYLLNVEHSVPPQSIMLMDIIPRSEPYIHQFTISNFQGRRTSDVDKLYEIAIKTTTNMPLDFYLYRNNVMVNIVSSDVTQADEDGTYFRYLKTTDVPMRHTQQVLNTYALYVVFPQQYDAEEYQNLIEYIQISVNSRQLIAN